MAVPIHFEARVRWWVVPVLQGLILIGPAIRRSARCREIAMRFAAWIVRRAVVVRPL